MTVARDILGTQRTAGRKHAEPRRKAGQKKRARRPAHPWPAGGTPVVAGVQPPGFAPVTEEVLQAIVHRRVTGLHPRKIILFGSYVYGTPTADSDVDLLVILDTPARPVDRHLRVSRLLRPRPFPLDLLVKTPEEIVQALDRGDAFMREITEQGRVLYERVD
jgi:predicted nucleotidyltransferase